MIHSSQPSCETSLSNSNSSPKRTQNSINVESKEKIKCFSCISLLTLSKVFEDVFHFC